MGTHQPQFIAEFTVEAVAVTRATNQFYPAQNDFSAFECSDYETQLL